jgi:putative membrane protein
MRKLCAILLILSFGIPAHAQSLSERTGLNRLLGISPSTEDFVREVVLFELLETELNKAAETKGNAKTKALAAGMLTEHKQTSAQLRALVRSGIVKVSYPAALDNERANQLAKLQSLSGSEFDAAFEMLQNEIHKQAISLFQRYGRGGAHPDLKNFAYRHLPRLQEHWRQLKDLSN